MRYITFLIATLIAGALSAQQYSTTDFTTGITMSCTQLFEVKAKSGVILRSEPTIKSAKLSKLKYTTVVSGCDLVIPVDDKIEGNEGTWLKIQHDGIAGYVFDAYLSRFEEHDVVFPGYFIERPASEDTYIAFKMDGDGLYSVPVSIKEFITDGVVSHNKMNKDSILFMIKGIRNQGRVQGIFCDDDIALSLYVGQSIDLGGGDILFADGKLIEEEGVLTLSGYSLNLLESRGGVILPKKQLFKATFDLEINYDILPMVRFAGDLDNDDQIDLLVQYSVGDEQCFDLLLSGVAEKNNALRLVAHTTSLWD